jgi:hypothetical protein
MRRGSYVHTSHVVTPLARCVRDIFTRLSRRRILPWMSIRSAMDQSGPSKAVWLAKGLDRTIKY